MDHISALFPNIAQMWNPHVRFVQDLINSDVVVIFSKSQCPYCYMAKDVFRKLRQPYTAIELDQRRDGEEIQEVLRKMTGAKSVPRIFINGRFIGGANDIKDLYETGKLRRILNK
ncbi:glutaredoxin-C4-like isoform X2 [Hermetia illucens]|uniref:glutaredoxin-C4-like isoform X2 n=1 Tax=Hermetia illucens TaxID=343691 RepID=UPI0018CBFC75|nr:glutaredoxin-C4-like isoform X2 [Hermetia illucens]